MMKNGLLKALKSIHTKQHIEASLDLPEGFKSWGSKRVSIENFRFVDSWSRGRVLAF